MTTLTGPAPTIERDRWGRPLIAPKPGAKKVAYTRATTVAKTLDDGNGLMLWKQRLTALGLVARRDLLTAIAATDPDDKKALNRLVGEAFESAGGSAAATTGTALHAFTERLDRGLDLGHVPAEHEADLAAYQRLADEIGWKVLDVELFTVDHQYKIAGTTDRVLEIDGQTYIADLKTGSSVDFHHAWAVQFAIYAGGLPYDIDAGHSTPWPYAPPSRERALVIHLPAGKGTAAAYWIDIEAGTEALRQSMWARRWRSRRDLLTAYTPDVGDELLRSIRRADSVARLERLWATNETSWGEQHTAAAAARKAALTGDGQTREGEEA